MLQAPQQRVQALLDELERRGEQAGRRSIRTRCSRRSTASVIGYVVIGGFARVVHGSAEVTDGLDIVPSLHAGEPPPPRPRPRRARRRRRLRSQTTLASREPVTVQTPAGELRLVPEPWGTRGYDDLRIRAEPREPRPWPTPRRRLGRRLRPHARRERTRARRRTPRPPPPDDGARAATRPPAATRPRTLSKPLDLRPPTRTTRRDSERDADASRCGRCLARHAASAPNPQSPDPQSP